MNAVSATQCSPRPLGGCGTRSFCAPVWLCARAAGTYTPAIDAPSSRAAMRARTIGALLPKAHLDVACGANILANVAANAFGVVRDDIAPDCALFFGHPVDCLLRAIDEASVALEAHSAAHAAHAFGFRLLLGEGNDALVEIAHDLRSEHMALR